MADTKLTALTYLSAFDTGGVYYTTEDTGGTPASRKIKGGVLLASVFKNVKLTEFTSSGTFTADSNSIGSLVFVTGGGGGGGGAAATDSASAAGAGAGSNGETRLIYYNSTEMGATAAVTIGAAGTAGANTGTNGGPGGDTIFNPVGTGATVTAENGLGGIGVNTVGFVFDVGGAAGPTGSGGFLISPSIGAGAGFATSPGSGNNKALGGQGSSSYWSSGGGGGASNGAAAAAGYAGAKGSGGGGGAESDNGGSAPGGPGGAGYVLVIEFLRS